MIAGVYKITNIKNGKFYIGSSTNVWGRWKQHVKDLMKGGHSCYNFQEDFVNHQLEDYTFNILEIYYGKINTSLDIYKLQDREQYYMDLYKDTGLLLNEPYAHGYSKPKLSKEEVEERSKNYTKWRKQLQSKHYNKVNYNNKKDIFVYKDKILIEHFLMMKDCCKWLLDNEYVITKSKNPLTTISGCIRYAIQQNKSYCGFTFSYEPLKN